jgi:hypothetical protein
VARCRVIVVVEVVIPKQLLAGRDVSYGQNPHTVPDFVNFAVGIAGMVQIGAHAFAVDDGLAIFQPIKVSAGRTVVQTVGLLGSEAWTRILDNASTLANGSCGKDTHCMDARGTNN